MNDKIEQLTAERDERIIKAVRAGLSAEHISHVEGLNVTSIGLLLKKRGIKKPEGKSPDTPYGLTAATASLRSRLGDKVRDLRSRGLPIEVAPLIGISPLAQARAIDGRWDWKMSELERLAEQEDIKFLDLILTLEKPTMSVGFDRMEDERKRLKWNSTLERYLIGPSSKGSGPTATTPQSDPPPSTT